jgi:hypothetical protein
MKGRRLGITRTSPSYVGDTIRAHIPTLGIGDDTTVVTMKC